jgi:hypothetical protein
MRIKTLGLGALLPLFLIGQAKADIITPAVEYATASPDTLNFLANTLGYEFTLSAQTTVNDLGVFYDGNGFPHQVGIWDSSGNLIISTTVLPADPVQGHFQWQQ